MAAAANQNGTVELFALGSNGSVFHHRQTAANTRNSFGGWSQMSGSLTSIALAYMPETRTEGVAR